MTKRLLTCAAGLLLCSGVWGQTGNVHLDRGRELLADGKWAAAHQEFVKLRDGLGADDALMRERADYYIAMCLSRLGEAGAGQALDNFTRRYPHSIYAADIALARGFMYYAAEDWERAASTLISIDVASIGRENMDEYYFKTGVSLFFTGNYEKAGSYLRQVAPASVYAMHAKYYNAYMLYAEGDYGMAKKLFAELASTEAYSAVAPYYIFQIEFLEKNYDYVIEHGDALMNAATAKRKAEIARVVAEAYFHQEYYGRTLEYMDVYVKNGGTVDRQEGYLTGYSKYMGGDYAGAIADLAPVYGPSDELSQNAVYHLADCYMKSGDRHKAMQSFALASAMDFDEVIKEDALFNYGQLQYEMGGGTFNEAINILSRYVVEYPRSPRAGKAREYLAAAYYNSNNFAAAYRAIKQIEHPDNNMRAALQKISYFRALEQYNAGQMNEALALLNESIATRANSKYTALGNLWKAEIFYRKGEYKSAIPMYRDFMLLAPSTEREYIMANYNLAYCYFNLQQWNAASDYFARFLKAYTARDAFRADTYNRLGDIAFADRSYWKAIENYDEALKIGTDEKYYAQYQRAVMLGLVGRPERKIESLQEIINRGQGTYVADATYELGRTYMGMQQYADAARVLKGFVAKYPQSPNYLRALSNLGLISQNLGDNQEAMRYYKMVVAKAPNSELSKDAMIGIRGAYMDNGNMDAYFSYAKKAGIETDLGAVQRDSLSFAAAERQYVSSKDKSRAEGLLKNYIADYPNGVYVPRAYYYIAEARLAASDKAAAMDNYEKVAGMYHNEYTVRALDKLARLSWETKQYSRAEKAFLKLSEESVDPATVGDALEGYLRSVTAQGDHSRSVEAADRVLSRNALSKQLIREASYAKAVACEALGNKKAAMELYTGLATETKSLEGAVSTFKVVEHLYEKGELTKAQKMAIDMGKDNTPHTYWLGKTFIVLGDIYAKQGDSFQARATYQSIVDGYTPDDDGVVETAKERIKGLK